MTTRSITPLSNGLAGSVHPPGSKSHTIRALFLAALARGTTTIVNPLDSDDTVRARECLRRLGVEIIEEDPTWVVLGSAGLLVPSSGPLDVGESGLTARLLIAVAALVNGATVISGRGRLPERPMDSILSAVEHLGATTTKVHPWEVHGQGSVPGGRIVVDGSVSSQGVSALLLIAPLARSEVIVEVIGAMISPGYVDMTVDMMRIFGAHPEVGGHQWAIPATGYEAAEFLVPIDGSALVYPAAAAAITGGTMRILGDPAEHPDLEFLRAIESMGCLVAAEREGIQVTGPGRLHGGVFDMSGAPDSAVALAVLCAVADGPSRIGGLGSLRYKESDRLAALQSELSKIGAVVTIDGDSVEITPTASIVPADLDSHHDHRLAMSLAIVGLVGQGISIRNSEAVAKTWPDFWEWLETTGVTISRS